MTVKSFVMLTRTKPEALFVSAKTEKGMEVEVSFLASEFWDYAEKEGWDEVDTDEGMKYYGTLNDMMTNRPLAKQSLESYINHQLKQEYANS